MISRYTNDHTRHLSDRELHELERRVDDADRRFQFENNGQGDYQTILATESRRMREAKER